MLYCINKSLYLAQYHVCLLTILEQTPVSDNIISLSRRLFSTGRNDVTYHVHGPRDHVTPSGPRYLVDHSHGTHRAVRIDVFTAQV